jgi:hypothetical protein
MYRELLTDFWDVPALCTLHYSLFSPVLPVVPVPNNTSTEHVVVVLVIPCTSTPYEYSVLGTHAYRRIARSGRRMTRQIPVTNMPVDAFQPFYAHVPDSPFRFTLFNPRPDEEPSPSFQPAPPVPQFIGTITPILSRQLHLILSPPLFDACDLGPMIYWAPHYLPPQLLLHCPCIRYLIHRIVCHRLHTLRIRPDLILHPFSKMVPPTTNHTAPMELSNQP